MDEATFLSLHVYQINITELGLDATILNFQNIKQLQLWKSFITH